MAKTAVTLAVLAVLATPALAQPPVSRPLQPAAGPPPAPKSSLPAPGAAPGLSTLPTIQAFRLNKDCHSPDPGYPVVVAYDVGGSVTRVRIHAARSAGASRLIHEDSSAPFQGRNVPDPMPAPETDAYVLEAQGPGGALSRRLAFRWRAPDVFRVGNTVRRVHVADNRYRYEADLLTPQPGADAYSVLVRREDGEESRWRVRLEGRVLLSEVAWGPAGWERLQRMAATFRYAARVRDCSGERWVEYSATLPAER